jgi:hypothetical protein
MTIKPLTDRQIDAECERRIAALGELFEDGEIDQEAYGEARRKIDIWALQAVDYREFVADQVI